MTPTLTCRNQFLADLGFTAQDIRSFLPVAAKLVSETRLDIKSGEGPLEVLARNGLMPAAVAALTRISHARIEKGCLFLA
jgi:hypothetical protein